MGFFERRIHSNLEKIYDNSYVRKIGDDDSIVIFSDLHMGDGSKRDDFSKNGDLFREVLTRYYERKGYGLILNGDVEELYKFDLPRIERRWSELFRIFNRFKKGNGLYKIYGNHDIDLTPLNGHHLETRTYGSIRLIYKGDPIFIFHGHQASLFEDHMFLIKRIGIRYLATPIGVMNYDVSNNNDTRFNVESRVYNFAKNRKLLAIIGHTHRPLFESLSKGDRLAYRIESLCRRYPYADDSEKQEFERRIRDHYQALLGSNGKGAKDSSRMKVYSRGPLIPCLFNSGCAIGKRGITGLEIRKGKIRLVHWFDPSRSKKFFSYDEMEPSRLKGTGIYRLVLNSEYLDYIFARIRLLS